MSELSKGLQHLQCAPADEPASAACLWPATRCVRPLPPANTAHQSSTSTAFRWCCLRHPLLDNCTWHNMFCRMCHPAGPAEDDAIPLFAAHSRNKHRLLRARAHPFRCFQSVKTASQREGKAPRLCVQGGEVTHTAPPHLPSLRPVPDLRLRSL